MNTELWARFRDCLKNSINERAYAYVEHMTCRRMTDEEWDLCLPDRSALNYVEVNLRDKLYEVLDWVLSEEGIKHDVRLSFSVEGAVDVEEVRPRGNSLFPSEALKVREVSTISDEKAAFQVSRPSRTYVETIPAEPFIASIELRKQSRLNERYRFDSFIQGNSNDVAFAASKAVASNPGGTDYNPLFLYGGVGLGKTHLMHAIGNEIIETCALRVRYTTCEEFQGDFVNALKNDCVQEWRTQIRENYDVLLIDDIQFISNKAGTQREFFHTFNELFEAKKQIVLASDRHPSEISDLEERIRSRFGAGGTFDIQLPDYETRLAILNQKARADNIYLPNDVAAYIASKVATNVRELEGCFKRIKMNAIAHKESITLELAQKLIDPYYQTRNVMLDAEVVINSVCRYFGISNAEMLGKSRAKPFAYPRQIAMYLARTHTALSFPDLGRVFGRDHTTVLHGYQRIMDDLLKKDMNLEMDIKRLEEELMK